MPSTSVDSSHQPRAFAGPWLICFAGIAAYLTSFGGTFQFDDIPALLDNPSIRSLWPPWAPWITPPGAMTVSGRPLLNASFALNWAVSGSSPWSYHLANLAIHLGSALLLFGIVRRVLEGRGLPHARSSALAVALLWCVHPLNTESVTYVVQRAESLMGLWVLLTLYAAVRYMASGEARWKAVSVLACLAGVATKEVGVVAPVIVLLYDGLFVSQSWGEALRKRRGYYLGLALSWVLIVPLLARTGWDRDGTSGFTVGVSWVGYWVTQGEAIARYLRLSVWPHPLAFDYGPASLGPVASWSFFLLVLAGALAVAVGCILRRPWAFLPACALLVLAPTSVMPGILQFMAEHRMYLPLAAVLTGIVLGVRRGVDSLSFVSPRMRAWGLSLALGASVVGLGTVTSERNRLYASDLELWRATAMVRPLSALAQANVGQALIARGRIEEAAGYCQRAVALDPSKPNARYNLGVVEEDLGHWDQALLQFREAARLNPRLIYAQARIGRILNRQGQFAEAEGYLRQALSREGAYADAWASLGVSLAGQGRVAEARDAYERSLSLEPRQPDVAFNLGVLEGRAGRAAAAEAAYRRAIALRPDYGEALLNLGGCLAQEDRLGVARDFLQQAVRAMPRSADAHGNLAIVLDQQGLSLEAVAEYEAAIGLRPQYPAAHYNLGNALLKLRRYPEALAAFERALALDPGFSEARQMRDRLAQALGRR